VIMASAEPTAKAGWEVKTLEEVCEMYQPKTISKKDMDPNGEYPVFGANGIIGRYSKFNHEDPELLITCRGATCGAVNISLPKSWINGNAMVVRPRSESLKQKFLKYLFTGGSLVEEAISGAAQPQITRTSLNPLQIPIAPLAEQERIVGILDEAFEGIVAATAQAKKNLHNARELFQSVLQSTFSHKGDDWVETTLENCCDTTQGVQIPKNQQRAEPREGFKRYLYISDFEHDQNLKYVLDEHEKKIVTEEDLVVANTGATAGKIFKGIDGILSNNLFKVSIFKQVADPVFFHYFVTSPLFKDFQSKIMRGTANPHMGHKNFKSTPIKLPPLSTQQAIVEKLDALSQETKRLEAIYERKQSALTELKQSLLQKAFAGAL
jgi:type I restriction enzyme, S subunit